MCTGNPNCNCGCQSSYTGIYGTNMWNVNSVTQTSGCGQQSPCNGCPDVIKALCVIYSDINLVNTGINKNDDLNTIIKKLDVIKGLQDQKNANILAALNDINSRINTLAGGTPHPAYTI